MRANSEEIVFQKALMNITSDGVNQIGFERALKQAGIEYQKNFLHYSKLAVKGTVLIQYLTG